MMLVQVPSSSFPGIFPRLLASLSANTLLHLFQNPCMEFLEHWRQLESAMENFKFKEEQSRKQFLDEGRLPSPHPPTGRGWPVPLNPGTGGLFKILTPGSLR